MDTSKIVALLKTKINLAWFQSTFNLIERIYSRYLRTYLTYTFSNLLNFATIIPTLFIALSLSAPNPLTSSVLDIGFHIILVVSIIFAATGVFIFGVTLIASSRFKELVTEGLEGKGYIPAGLSLLTISLFSIWLNFVGLNTIFASHVVNENIDHNRVMILQSNSAQTTSTIKTREDANTVNERLLQIENRLIEEITSKNSYNFDYINDSFFLMPSLNKESGQMEKTQK